MPTLPIISQNIFVVELFAAPQRRKTRYEKKVLRNSWQRTHDEPYDNRELAMLTHLWKCWVIYDPTVVEGLILILTTRVTLMIDNRASMCRFFVVK